MTSNATALEFSVTKFWPWELRAQVLMNVCVCLLLTFLEQWIYSKWVTVNWYRKIMMAINFDFLQQMFPQCQINLFNLPHVLMYPIYYLHVSTCTTEKRNSKGMARVHQDSWWGDCLQNQDSWLQLKIENYLEARDLAFFLPFVFIA